MGATECFQGTNSSCGQHRHNVPHASGSTSRADRGPRRPDGLGTIPARRVRRLFAGPIRATGSRTQHDGPRGVGGSVSRRGYRRKRPCQIAYSLGLAKLSWHGTARLATLGWEVLDSGIEERTPKVDALMLSLAAARLVVDFLNPAPGDWLLTYGSAGGELAGTFVDRAVRRELDMGVMRFSDDRWVEPGKGHGGHLLQAAEVAHLHRAEDFNGDCASPAWVAGAPNLHRLFMGRSVRRW